jgi:hypothetical protein
VAALFGADADAQTRQPAANYQNVGVNHFHSSGSPLRNH